MQMKSAGLGDKTFSMPELEKGLRAALEGKEVKREDLEPLNDYLVALAQAKADENHAKAKAFLATNAKKPGVITTASGLQYKVLQAGKGVPPKPTDTVSVKYTGKLLDGTEFDGTDRRGDQPASLPVGGALIAGFKEALLLMKPGAKYQIFVSPELGFGMQSSPRSPIPGGSAVIFDIELLKILPPAPPVPVLPPHPAVPPSAHPAVPPAH
jgi:FKBP-type peptidyl-prolyl cis-trans isomerase FklB